jgi:hypothetical protein
VKTFLHNLMRNTLKSFRYNLMLTKYQRYIDLSILFLTKFLTYSPFFHLPQKSINFINKNSYEYKRCDPIGG